jgi:hypothetical protein
MRHYSAALAWSVVDSEVCRTRDRRRLIVVDRHRERARRYTHNTYTTPSAVRQHNNRYCVARWHKLTNESVVVDFERVCCDANRKQRA